MESRIIELASQSRRGLELGKDFCTQADFTSQQIEQVLNFIQLFWPKLKFINQFLNLRIKNFKDLLTIGYLIEKKLTNIIQLKIKENNNLNETLENLFHQLKSVKITHLDYSSPPHPVLFDYVEWDSAEKLKKECTLQVEEWIKIETELHNQLEEFDNILNQLLDQVPEDHDSVSLEESGVQYAFKKLNEHQGRTESMARILGSLERHHSQVTGVLKSLKQGEIGQKVDLYILERDSEELPTILEELEQSVEVVELLKQDAIVRHQLYEAIYQEKIQILSQLMNNLPQFLKLSKLIQQIEKDLISKFNYLDQIMEELWNLEKKYASCIQAYQHVEQEYRRREQVHLHQQQIIHQFQLNLDRFYNEEKKTREEFIQKIEDYLPSNLGLSIRELPLKYTITQVVESQSPFTAEPNFSLNLSQTSNQEINQD